MQNSKLPAGATADSEQQPIEQLPAQLAAIPVLPAAFSAEQGNRLIAKFMGGIYRKSAITLEEDLDRIYLGDEEVMYQIKSRHERYSLKYHSSWDWLMPVVEKIECLGIGYMVYINTDQFELYKTPHTEVTVWINDENKSYKWHCVTNDVDKIKAVWLAVIQFISWYNKNQPVSKR